MSLPTVSTEKSAAAINEDRPTPFDVKSVRADFPILNQEAAGKSLVYLDNAATTQKPQSVIDYLNRYYALQNSNIHRGVYRLSEAATEAYEGARHKIQRFINAADHREIVFTRGTTESINLVAETFGKMRVGQGDEVVVTELEHHSNIVPWYLLCREQGAVLRHAPIDDRGDVDLDALEGLITDRTRLIAIAHVSNSLGTVVPIRNVVDIAHGKEVPVVIDGAQALPHLPVDVQDLGCDFYAFSGHKVFGPTGIGALYGRYDLLKEMPPYQGGGSMIQKVTFDEITFADPPTRFEAGTPDIAGAIGFGVAIDYLNALDLEGAFNHEHDLLDYAARTLDEIDGLRIIGTAEHKAGVLSFDLGDIHPHDIGTILDQESIAIRTGHHCAQPVMAHYDIPATARASFAFYNTREDIDRLALGVRKVLDLFR
ncbi:MAG: cysteine desulfurase CsdA [Gemmatimonadetes bacterium]|nr:cysteine desulfurase CsdA [Gemmatimonadota bacterium]|tara:strand:- start:1479 stop:2759 length:1281 start_codon:yes stop_codon:yes gene_type:complete